jgi:hypothetical protein
MPHSTASCAALESAQCDFSHSLLEFCNTRASRNLTFLEIIEAAARGGNASGAVL